MRSHGWPQNAHRQAKPKARKQGAFHGTRYKRCLLAQVQKNSAQKVPVVAGGTRMGKGKKSKCLPTNVGGGHGPPKNPPPTCHTSMLQTQSAVLKACNALMWSLQARVPLPLKMGKRTCRTCAPSGDHAKHCTGAKICMHNCALVKLG